MGVLDDLRASKNLQSYPTSTAERNKALQIRHALKEQGKKIPYYMRNNDPTDIHYWDNKGGGRWGLRDLKTKLAGVAGQKARKIQAQPTLQHYIDAHGKDKGLELYNLEKEAVHKVYKANNPKLQDVDHINSLADGGLHASRNLRNQDLKANRSEQARKFPKFKQEFLGTNVTPQDYPKLHGPWPAEEMRNNIINGPDDPDEFAKYWVKKNNHSGNINYEGKGTKGNLGKLTKVAGALAAAGALTPTQQAAAQAREEILQGNYTQAGLTIGTDLVKSQTTGQVVAQGTKLAAKVAQQKIGRLVGKNVVKHAIKLVGKSAAKKGLALATGPAAPAIIAGLVVMDVYVAADALSGGGLTQFFKNQANKLKIQGPKMDPATAANSLKIMR